MRVARFVIKITAFQSGKDHVQQTGAVEVGPGRGSADVGQVGGNLRDRAAYVKEGGAIGIGQVFGVPADEEIRPGVTVGPHPVQASLGSVQVGNELAVIGELIGSVGVGSGHQTGLRNPLLVAARHRKGHPDGVEGQAPEPGEGVGNQTGSPDRAPLK